MPRYLVERTFPDGLAIPKQGAMGIHFANGGLVGDGALDALHPEALLYEPKDSIALEKYRRSPRVRPPEERTILDAGQYRSGGTVSRSWRNQRCSTPF